MGSAGVTRSNWECLAQLDDMTKPLGFYAPEDGWGIHVHDSDPNSLSAGGWLENTALVKKYEISEEDYDKREGTVRKWIQSKKAQDPTWTIEKEMMRRRDPNWSPPLQSPRTTSTMRRRYWRSTQDVKCLLEAVGVCVSLLVRWRGCNQDGGWVFIWMTLLVAARARMDVQKECDILNVQMAMAPL